jgi:SAM-dependent methyltransferase
MAEPIPAGGGVECFDTPDALTLNRARLTHLASLGLPLEGRRVLEVGAGVGHLSGFFLERDCDLVVTEGRPENVAELRRRFPNIEASDRDVEEPLTGLGRFQIVFCYGTLYHLENPVRALRNMADVCDELLLIETMVCDSSLPVMRLDDETRSVNQALRGIAHRPSPAYLALTLNRIGFRHDYTTVDQPDFPDFDWVPHDNLDIARDGHLLRRVFVASHHEISSDRLVHLID